MTASIHRSAAAQDAVAPVEFRDHGFCYFDSEASRTADITLADMDEDGDQDARAANGHHWAESDRLFLNSGNERFLKAIPLGERLSAGYRNQVDDFDDGDPDIVTLRDTLDAPLHINLGDGSFAPPIPIADTVNPVQSGATADLDDDGRLDVVIATRRCADMILYGSGTSGFEPVQSLPDMGRGTTGAAIGDLIGDGKKIDIVIVNSGARNIVLIQR